MRIGIDGNEANVRELVGVSVYTKNLLVNFSKKADVKTQFTIFLKKPPLSHLPRENKNFKYKVIGPPLLWSRLALPLALKKDKKLDVFFSPAHYSPSGNYQPLVVTIHDLSYFYYPEEFLKKDLYKLKRWTETSVHKAKKVICVSKKTKEDVMKFYKIQESKITVIYNGYLSQLSNSPTLKTEKYILYVGTLQPRKNISTLVTAFNEFKKKNPEFTLRIVGRKGWIYKEIFQLVNDLQLNDDVHFEGYVADNKLISFYKNAFCFVLPSFYEGFGIPVLEAMANDCPVIASNISSLPEVGGNACLYFNPNDSNDLVEKLEEIKDENVRKSLIQKGKIRIKKFSWEKCAEETLKVLASLY